jgi:hypothetical protein
MRVGQETGQTNRLRNGSIFTVKVLAGFDLEFSADARSTRIFDEATHGCVATLGP